MRSAIPKPPSLKNQQYYAKRLNTQSFLEPSFKQDLPALTAQIQKQIQTAKRSLKDRKITIFKANHKLHSIHNEEELMRDTLRSKIQSRIQLSQTNLEKIMLGKVKESRSHSRDRERTIDRFRSTEKDSMEQSFRKSQLLRNESEKYLNSRSKKEQRSKATSYSEFMQNTKYQSTASTKYASFGQLQPRKRILPHVLKVSDNLLHDKQSTKNNLQQTKQAKNLHSYIEKLQHIESNRISKTTQLEETLRKKEKRNSSQRQKMEYRKNNLSLNEKTLKDELHPVGMSKQRNSFSEIYSRKLQEKLNRKALFSEMEFREGNRVLAEAHLSRSRDRNNKFVKDAVREVQRKVNFGYRERVFK